MIFFSRPIFGWILSKVILEGQVVGEMDQRMPWTFVCLLPDTFFNTLSQGYYSAHNRNSHWLKVKPLLYKKCVCFDVGAGQNRKLHHPHFSLQSVVPVVYCWEVGETHDSFLIHLSHQLVHGSAKWSARIFSQSFHIPASTYFKGSILEIFPEVMNTALDVCQGTFFTLSLLPQCICVGKPFFTGYNWVQLLKQHRDAFILLSLTGNHPDSFLNTLCYTD